MKNNIEKIIRKYISEVIHMSIATSSDNVPWISEVHFSYDDELNFYFISLPNRRHSSYAASNPRIAGNIIKQHKKGENVRGVYFEGQIEMLENVRANEVSFKTYRDRFESDDSILQEQTEDNGHHFYKISVERFYLYDELELKPAGKYELDWKTI